MKKLFMMILVGVLGFTMAGCSDTSNNTDQVENKTENQEEQHENLNQNKDSKSLVAYFTYAENANLPDDVDTSSSASIQVWNDEVTGNAGVLAHMISEYTGADLFSIKTVQQYPSTYDETVDQGQSENEENVRPELATHIENLDEYDTIFIGFPNWWYDMPMAMYSFFEEYDFSGKTIIPFSTSGGSGFSSTIETMKELEPNATVEDNGITIGASNVRDAQEQMKEWLQSFGY